MPKGKYYLLGKTIAVDMFGIKSWTFGEPALRADNNAVAYWSKTTTSPKYQKSGTGWQPCLHGNVQTGDDWAAVYIPVNELKVTDFNTAKWSYFMGDTEVYGANIVIWVHDQHDFDKRAEITQSGSATSLAKGAGWNAHEFPGLAAEFFYYGENTSGTGLTAGTIYTWAQFQADALFAGWKIYRISIEMGWYSTGTFAQVWIGDLSLNGKIIKLQPQDGDLDSPVFQYQTGTGAISAALSPKTPFQLESIMVHFASAQTQDTFTVKVDAGRAATVYDTLLYSRATATGSVTDLVIPFGRAYRFKQDDEIDVAYPGVDNDVYGLTYCFKILP